MTSLPPPLPFTFSLHRLIDYKAFFENRQADDSSDLIRPPNPTTPPSLFTFYPPPFLFTSLMRWNKSPVLLPRILWPSGRRRNTLPSVNVPRPLTLSAQRRFSLTPFVDVIHSPTQRYRPSGTVLISFPAQVFYDPSFFDTKCSFYPRQFSLPGRKPCRLSFYTQAPSQKSFPALKPFFFQIASIPGPLTRAPNKAFCP